MEFVVTVPKLWEAKVWIEMVAARNISVTTQSTDCSAAVRLPHSIRNYNSLNIQSLFVNPCECFCNRPPTAFGCQELKLTRL